MRHHVRSSVVALSAAGALCLVTALSGSASAVPAKGVKGDPQPELTPFTIGASAGSAGNVAVESNGDLVVAYVASGPSGDVKVCVLARAGHTCTFTNTLVPQGADSGLGNPQVFASSPDHVAVLMGAGSDHGNLLFSSTDGGKTFDAGVLVGNAMGVDTGVLIGSNIVYADTFPSGVRVAEVSTTTPAPPTEMAIPTTHEGSVGVSDYKGGVLVASDNGESGPTTVEYAAAPKDPGATGSYAAAGSFAGESFIAISGDALLTEQGGGKEALELRYFNGTSFGSAHTVPGSGGGGPEWFTMTKDPGGVTHVFEIDDRTSPLYEVEALSTTSGAHWSSATPIGNATADDYFSATLDQSGSGILLGAAPARAYPVLAEQSVTFALKTGSVKKGHKTTGSGKAKVAAKGRTVELQVEKAGRWFDVASTHESSSGSFTFSIKGSSPGTFHYRAVAADHAGYVQFGYSPARSLAVKK